MYSIDINYTFTQLIQVIPEFLSALLISIILTPIIGKIAKWTGTIDLPALQRKRTDRTLETRIHKNPIPRLGGVAIYISFILLFFYTYGFTSFTVSVGTGITVLTLIGIIDDKYDLHGGIQLLVQILSVSIIILSGVRILGIDIFNLHLNFDQIRIPFDLFDQTFSFIFPADLITLFWFIVIINAMNWVAGIDALEETMGWVAGATLMLIAIKFGKNDILPMTSIFTGAVIGFWIYNFPPSKIMGGTVGNTLLGLLLAVFSIKIDGKFTTTLLILALPIVDFMWVVIGRIFKYKVINPIRLMSISGRHHFHHRLMELGYSNKQILLIEITIFSLFGVLAYYMAGFNKTTVAILGGFALLLILFTFITIRKFNKKKRADSEKDGGGDIIKQGKVEESPEKVYAY